MEAIRTGQRPAGELAYLARALRRHVVRTADRLRALSEVSVVGAVYNLDTGRVELT